MVCLLELFGWNGAIATLSAQLEPNHPCTLIPHPLLAQTRSSRTPHAPPDAGAGDLSAQGDSQHVPAAGQQVCGAQAQHHLGRQQR